MQQLVNLAQRGVSSDSTPLEDSELSWLVQQPWFDQDRLLSLLVPATTRSGQSVDKAVAEELLREDGYELGPRVEGTQGLAYRIVSHRDQAMVVVSFGWMEWEQGGEDLRYSYGRHSQESIGLGPLRANLALLEEDIRSALAAQNARRLVLVGGSLGASVAATFIAESSFIQSLNIPIEVIGVNPTGVSPARAHRIASLPHVQSRMYVMADDILSGLGSFPVSTKDYIFVFSSDQAQEYDVNEIHGKNILYRIGETSIGALRLGVRRTLGAPPLTDLLVLSSEEPSVQSLHGGALETLRRSSFGQSVLAAVSSLQDVFVSLGIEPYAEVRNRALKDLSNAEDRSLQFGIRFQF